jgi:serine/threonine protein kinase
MSHSPLALPPGQILDNNYEIEGVLGQGGFAITYRARDRSLNAAVAIKEFFPTGLATRTSPVTVIPVGPHAVGQLDWARERFRKEAQTLAKFRHPNIVRVLRVFEENNTAYAVLDFENGPSLKSWLQELGRPLTQIEFDALAAPLLSALEVVHGGGLLHRDIAPDNIIRRADGMPVLIDFGAAKGMVGQTVSANAMVKHGYSPWEQYTVDTRRQGPWTDIYALAATFYFALMGVHPPEGPERTQGDTMTPAMSLVNRGYRRGCLGAIDHGLRPRIEERPQSVTLWRAELLAEATAVASAATGRPSAFDPELTAPLSQPGAARSMTGVTERVEGGFFPASGLDRMRRAGPLAWAGAAAAVLALVAGVIVAIVGLSGGDGSVKMPPVVARVPIVPDPPSPLPVQPRPPSLQPPAPAQRPPPPVVAPVPAPVVAPVPAPAEPAPSVPERTDDVALARFESCVQTAPCNLTRCRSAFDRDARAAGGRLLASVERLAADARSRCLAQSEPGAFAELQSCGREQPCGFASECLPAYTLKAGQEGRRQRGSAIEELSQQAANQCTNPQKR